MREKTMACGMYLEQRQRKKRYLPAKITGVEIQLDENFGGATKTFKQYEANEVHKLLGILTYPESTLGDQIKYMTEQATKWGKKIESSMIHSKLKHSSFNTALIPQLRFPLLAIAISEANTTTMMKQTMVAIRHCLGLANLTDMEIFGGYPKLGSALLTRFCFQLMQQKPRAFNHRPLCLISRWLHFRPMS